MLVPITSSLYVPGETTQLDTVLVDVGTGARLAFAARTAAVFLTPRFSRSAGYFIEKGVEEAQAFLTRKMALIESQAQNVQSAAQFKNQNLSQTVDVMNRKIMEAREAGAGSSSGTAL